MDPGAGGVGAGAGPGAVDSTARRVRVDSRLHWLDEGEPCSRLSRTSFVSPRGGWGPGPSPGWSSREHAGSTASAPSLESRVAASWGTGSAQLQEWSQESLESHSPVVARLDPAWRQPSAQAENLAAERAGLGELEYKQQRQQARTEDYIQREREKARFETDKRHALKHKGFHR